MSRKPAVVISAVFAPLRSSTVLIAMVEPCSSSSMAATSQSASARAVAAPSVGSAGTVSVFAVTMAPSWRPTRSVKVPPISMPTMLKVLELHRHEFVVVERLGVRHVGEDAELLERVADHVDRLRVPGAVGGESRHLRVVDFRDPARADVERLGFP